MPRRRRPVTYRAGQPFNKPKPAPENPNKMELIYGGLLNSDCFSDFTISTNDTSFKVNKSILAMRSPKFRAMFNVDMKESRENILQLDFIDSDILGKFLRYLYTNKLELVKEDPKIRTHQAVELFKLADEYLVPGLKAICKNELIRQFPAGFAIKINQPRHIFDLLNFADIYGLDVLKERILKFVTTHRGAITVWKDYLREFGSQSPELGMFILRSLAKATYVRANFGYCPDCDTEGY